jgi:WD40 repeat protein
VTGKLLQAVRLERELVAVAFSPDGGTLLTGNATGKIRAWDISTLMKGN